MSKKCYESDKKRGEKHTRLWYAFCYMKGENITID